MGKHAKRGKHGKYKDNKRWMEYPLRIYKHWALNQWYFFQKPKLKQQWKALSTKVQHIINPE